MSPISGVLIESHFLGIPLISQSGTSVSCFCVPAWLWTSATSDEQNLISDNKKVNDVLLGLLVLSCEGSALDILQYEMMEQCGRSAWLRIHARYAGSTSLKIGALLTQFAMDLTPSCEHWMIGSRPKSVKIVVIIVLHASMCFIQHSRKSGVWIFLGDWVWMPVTALFSMENFTGHLGRLESSMRLRKLLGTTSDISFHF